MTCQGKSVPKVAIKDEIALAVAMSSQVNAHIGGSE